jgi:hypothetical protein
MAFCKTQHNSCYTLVGNTGYQNKLTCLSCTMSDRRTEIQIGTAGHI